MSVELRYQPDPDQLELVAAFGEPLAAVLPLARLHESAHETPAVWSELEGLGLFGVAVPEEAGGSGLGIVEETHIAMALGRSLASPAVLATLAAAPAWTDGQTRRTAAGYRTARGAVVVDEPGADFFLVQGEGVATLHAAAPLGNEGGDDRQWLGQLRPAPELGDAIATFEGDKLLRLRLLNAAALAGVAEAAVAMAVDYAKLREQFGRPIGAFQAVKHHCANMAIAARAATDLASAAAVALADGRPEAALQIESAFLIAGAAAVENAGKNIQVHGGIGFSDEADPHLLLKRAQLLVTIGGGLEAALDRVATLEGPAANN
jgi:alkylation response protein AidB-like acyl-CoA dehydrogenase